MIAFGMKKEHGVTVDMTSPPMKIMDQHDIDKAFARCFSSDDGQTVLSHLQAITFQRAHMPTAAESELRYSEGQRALMATILRMVNRGKGN